MVYIIIEQIIKKKTSKFGEMTINITTVKLNECYYPDELRNLNISDGNFIADVPGL